jgi:hypothetical protein
MCYLNRTYHVLPTLLVAGVDKTAAGGHNFEPRGFWRTPLSSLSGNLPASYLERSVYSRTEECDP